MYEAAKLSEAKREKVYSFHLLLSFGVRCFEKTSRRSFFSLGAFFRATSIRGIPSERRPARIQVGETHYTI